MIDKYLAMSPSQREEWYSTASAYQRGLLHGQVQTRLAENRQKLAAHYEGAYADPDIAAEAKRQGLTPQQYVHNRFGAPGDAVRPVAPADPYVSKLRERLGVE